MSRNDSKHKTGTILHIDPHAEFKVVNTFTATTAYTSPDFAAPDQTPGMASIRGTGGTLGLMEIADKTMRVFAARLEEIDRRLSTVEGKLTGSPEIVLIEEMSRDEAKKRIESFFETHDRADTEELMRNLRIDLPLLVEMLDELKKEGKIRSLGTS